jgi:integrase/recombinase XerD
MRSSTTFSVLFWVYSQRADKNNLSNIYVRITVNGKKVNLSINQKADISSWDSKRQRIKGNSNQARTINLLLDDVKSGIVQCYRDLEREDKVLSAQLIKARFLGEDKRVRSLKDIFKYHNDKMGVNLHLKLYVITRPVRNTYWNTYRLNTKTIIYSSKILTTNLYWVWRAF